MATSDNQMCSICLDEYKQPKFLDCHHSFCLECIRSLENRTPGFINCPLCQKEIQLPSGGVDKLTTNFYIQDTPPVGVEGGEVVSRGVENGEGFHNDTTMVGIEGGETLSRGVENREGLHNDTTMVEVEGGEAVSGEVENGEGLHNDSSMVGVEGGEAVSRGVVNGEGLQIVEGVSERKTITLDFPAENYIRHDVSFGGVIFQFHLIKNQTDKWGETLALRMSKGPFVLSCQVEYDITLVNQDNKKFSTKRTGHCDFETETNLKVDLIKMCHAKKFDFGFISLNKPRSRCRKEVDFYELDIYISLSNVKYIDFNLK